MVFKFLGRLLLILLCISIVFFVLNQLANNSYDGNNFSNNAKESKEENLFIGYYIPNKDSIQLIGRKIKTKQAWCEVGWKRTHNFIFFTDKEIDYNNTMNFIIEDTGYCSQHEYIYQYTGNSRTLNCMHTLGPIINCFYRSDTLTLYIEQGTKKDGWLYGGVISDSIIYTRKQ